MPISIKENVVREITTMVRKGTIQFDMNDRPVLDLNRTDKAGRKISYCIGSIGHNEDSSGLFYTLYTSDGSFVPSSKGPRSIDSLYSKELVAVRDRVAQYLDMAINRSKNLEAIMEFAQQHSNGYSFDGAVRPSAFLDYGLDGKLIEMKVDSIFFPDPSVTDDRTLFCSGMTASGQKVTVPVTSLNDRAVANVVTCLGLDKKKGLSQSQEVVVDKPVKKSSQVSL